MNFRVFPLCWMVGLAFSCLAGIDEAAAATFQVTKTLDDDGACLPNDCSLREAMIAAHQDSPGPDLILVPAGVHLLTIPSVPDLHDGPGLAIGNGEILEVRGTPNGQAIIDTAGADSVFIVGSLANLTLTDLRLRGGASELGGAIASFISQLQVVRCTIEGRATLNGAGVRIQGGQVLVQDSTIAGGQASFLGGGILFEGSSSADVLRVVNSTISGNSAPLGGGIAVQGGGRLELVHVTFAGNDASVEGDSLRMGGGSATVTNSLFDDGCQAAAPVNLPVSLGGNLERGGATCFAPIAGDQTSLGDALLEPLANNGGPTATHALLPESPALDQASAAFCEPTDQRGAPRPSGPGCDVGSFELGAGGVVEVPTLGDLGSTLLALLLATFAWRRLGGG